MDASVTIRFPGLAVPNDENGKTSQASAARADAEAGVSDEALMAQIGQGSREALAALFRRYARMVRGVAYRVLQDPSEADDLLQDIFLLVHRDCRMFDSSKSPVRFWLLQMTHRRAISRRRYLNSRHFYTRADLENAGRELPAPENTFPPHYDSITSAIGRGVLHKAFELLSKDQAETLRLFFFEGYTLDEIAAKLGQSRGNVKHHYFRGLDKLRKELFGNQIAGRATSMIKGLVQPRSGGVVTNRTP
jgi:RNA polymerase sigma-70 factor (ECF subfamily)